MRLVLRASMRPIMMPASRCHMELPQALLPGPVLQRHLQITVDEQEANSHICAQYISI